MQDFGSVEWYEGDAPKPSTPRICFDQDTEEYYTKAFKAVKDKGGNLVRFWLFFDGRAAPRFDLSHDSLRDNVLGWDEEVSHIGGVSLPSSELLAPRYVQTSTSIMSP